MILFPFRIFFHLQAINRLDQVALHMHMHSVYSN